MRSHLLAPTCCLLLCHVFSSACAQDAARWPPTMVDSASLHAVACVDEQHAWAVGERGAILSTHDGGATWTPYPNRLTTNALHGVSFSDRQQGIIVGGEARPYQLPSEGIVLHTRDAGRTWETADRILLPQLKSVAHTDSDTAIAIGDASPLFLSGVFRSVDGGRSWNCIPTRNMQDWEQGDLTNPTQMLLTSCEWTLSRCAASRTVDVAGTDVAGTDVAGTEHALREVRDAAWISSDHALAVGNQGTLLESLDQGRTWQPCQNLAQHPLAQQFDFRTVWARQGCIWIAGLPGTHIFRSADDGRTWSVAETGQALPLNALDFADPQHGLAVGEFGVALLTDDGGKTWNVSRGRGYRAGVLVVCETCADMPFDVIAQLSCIDQFRCQIVVSEASAAQLRQATAAARRVGADNVERLARSQTGHTVQLVRQLLAYRPDTVVVADRADSHEAKGPLLQCVKDAIQVTGDASRLASSVGPSFAPWRVKRLLHTTSHVKTAPASISIDTASAVLPLRTSLGAMLIEAYSFLEDVRGEMGAAWECRTPTTGSRLLPVSIGELSSEATLLGGMQASFDGESRRPLAGAVADDLWLRRQATEYHATLSLLDRAISGGGCTAAEQLVPLTRDLPEQDRTRVLMWVVSRCRQLGLSALAQETLHGILQIQSADVHTMAAILARFRAATGDELQDFLKAQARAPQTTSTLASRGLIQQTADVSPSELSPATVPRLAVRNAQVELETLLKQLPPDITSQPWVQLAVASERRRVSDPQDRQRIYKLLQGRVANVEWRRCLAIESWLTDLQPDPRRPVPPDVIFVKRAEVPPILDGSLDEPAWQDGTAIRLAPRGNPTSAAGCSTVVHLARDEQFFFVAFDCQGGEAKPRPQGECRDVDISAFDHVELRLDVDRDYSTGWEISVDCRGCANDRVDGDPAWNPKWHLAMGRRGLSWIAELAIPLREIATQTPLRDRSASTWVAGIRRSPAGKACQVWPGGAGQKLPWQQCGYLVLEDRITERPEAADRSSVPARTR